MTSTPTSSGPSEAELRNFVDVPKPFKSSASGKIANRRNRNLKQILAAERDAAMGIDPSTKKLKSGGAGTAGARKMLTGAAAAAARRREELMANSAAPSGTATPAELDGGDTSAAMTDIDMDTLTTSALGSDGTRTPAANMGSEAIKRRLLPSYASIEAPPSLRPRKKFCDITGLIAPYTDPKTGLRYHSVEMYEVIKTFGPGVDQSYLTLRGDNSLIK